MSTVNKHHALAALCQMTSSADKIANFNVAKQLLEEAALQGADMAFLPEAFDYIAESKEQAVELGENLSGETIQHFCDLAIKLKLWLSLGGFHQMAENNKLKNSHVVIDNTGKIAAIYNKAHLFDVNIQTKEKVVQLKESDHAVAGREIVAPVSTPIGKLGLSICYDLRFPEMALALRNMGADILTYPSAFTVLTGKAHWEILLRNKAIENQCYVIAAAQCGQHNSKRASFGHSMIVDPFGRIVASLEDNPGVALAEINLKYLNTVRQEMPLEQHRRKDLYGLINSPRNLISQDDFLFGSVNIDASQRFYESNYSFGFVNKKPVIPGHVLVSPKRVTKRLADLATIEMSDLFLCVQKIQRAIEKEHDATSSTIAIQDGPEAGQTIEHLHVHILPRKRNDFEQNDDVYALLERHDAEDQKMQMNFRTKEEMAAEALQLRKYFV